MMVDIMFIHFYANLFSKHFLIFPRILNYLSTFLPHIKIFFVKLKRNTHNKFDSLKDLDKLETTWNIIQKNMNRAALLKFEDLENNEQVKATPTMVISVIGDSDSFVPRPWPKTVFQTALIEAAKSGKGKIK